MPGPIVVVGLGPGDPGLVTEATLAAIAATPRRFLRTRRHPSASLVEDAASFDAVYEQAATFEEVYATIVAALVQAASAGTVLYAVPGSPFVAEHTVELLRAASAPGAGSSDLSSGLFSDLSPGPAGLEVHLLPALSFVDLAWARLGIDPFEAGAHLVDGHRFASEAAGQGGPFLVGQCDRPDVLSDIKLAVAPSEPAAPLVILQRLGLPDEAVTEVAWDDLDRTVEPDHLTSVWVPRLGAPVAGEVAALVDLVETLRRRCPWDGAQTHRTLARHLLEETYEVLDAIDGLPEGAGSSSVAFSDPEADEAYFLLEEELGDLLFQVVFHSRLGTEAGRFDLADVARGIHDKLYQRHPHVFGTEEVTSAGELSVSWEQRKKAEKGRTSVMDGIPTALPGLAYAEKVQRKAASLRLDWEDLEGVWAKVEEELGELRAALAAAGVGSSAGSRGDAGSSADFPGDAGSSGGNGFRGVTGTAEPPAEVVAELGDVLFTVVNLARKAGVEAEDALRSAANRFRRRVGIVEELAAEAGVEPAAAGAEQLDIWWEEAKTRP